MRDLSETLEAAQKLRTFPGKVKVVLTSGETSYTYQDTGSNRLLAIKDFELQPHSHKATVIIDNSDNTLTTIDLQAFQAVISFGATTSVGNEYDAQPPLWVLSQRFESYEGILTCVLSLWGIPNRMSVDKAKSLLQPEDDDTTTVKTYISGICAATLAPYADCQAYTVDWDDETGADYKPKDNFRIYVSDVRLDKLKELLEYTELQMRVEADGHIHIFLPTTTGISYDYTYTLSATYAAGEHTFFAKAYQSTLVIPNKVTVQSYDDEDNQYSGSATSAASYAKMPIPITVEKWNLTNDAEADELAEAYIARAELWANAGSVLVPINFGAEVFDYVKVVDARNGDTRTGNVGFLRINYRAAVGRQQPKWEMSISFGDWSTLDKILGGLGTSVTELQRYFSRLMVKNLYAENITVEYLSAIAADMGLLNAGFIIVGTGTVGTNFSGIILALVGSLYGPDLNTIYGSQLPNGSGVIVAIASEVLKAKFDTTGLHLYGQACELRDSSQNLLGLLYGGSDSIVHLLTSATGGKLYLYASSPTGGVSIGAGQGAAGPKAGQILLEPTVDLTVNAGLDIDLNAADDILLDAAFDIIIDAVDHLDMEGDRVDLQSGIGSTGNSPANDLTLDAEDDLFLYSGANNIFLGDDLYTDDIDSKSTLKDIGSVVQFDEIYCDHVNTSGGVYDLFDDLALIKGIKAKADDPTKIDMATLPSLLKFDRQAYMAKQIAKLDQHDQEKRERLTIVIQEFASAETKIRDKRNLLNEHIIDRKLQDISSKQQRAQQKLNQIGNDRQDQVQKWEQRYEYVSQHFIPLDKTVSLLLGAVKQLTEKVEALEAK